LDHSWGYGSDQRLREENQDCFGVFDFPDYTLAIVCDGMGGHVGGAHASTLAVRTIHDTMRELVGRPVEQALEEAISRTNVVIHEASRKNHRLNGMGTTVVAAVLTRDTLYLAHVGDSRAYLVRRGQVQQLTRDHTMVNLFVDAELLSPEDAATHPEAHVLSRSLGVERQVDVELSDPIPLLAGDVVFLCSDGVHGIVTDWELGNQDWGLPQEATQDILHIISNREGDDNATAVAVLMGTSPEDTAATPVPELKPLDDNSGGGIGMTAVPLEEEDIVPGGGRSDGGPGYVVYEDHPIREPYPDSHDPQPLAQQQNRSGSTPDPANRAQGRNRQGADKQGPQDRAPPQGAYEQGSGRTPIPQGPGSDRSPNTPSGMNPPENNRKESAKPAKPPKPRRNWILPVVLATAALFMAICGVAGLLVIPKDSVTGVFVDLFPGEATPLQIGAPEPTAAPAPGTAPAAASSEGGQAANMGGGNPAGSPPGELPPVAPGDPGSPGDGVAAIAEPEPEPEPGPPAPPGAKFEMTKCPSEGWLFRPRTHLPPSPRRLPSRPANCTQPPPGGQWQVRAIEHSRKRECPEALSAVQEGMKHSIDHCTLYRTAWLCFNETYQRPLEDVEANLWEDLVLYSDYFNGKREVREAQVKSNPELQRQPSWYHPAPSGIEFRLEAWANDVQMQSMVTDLFGEPTVTDQLAKDLHLEALAAAGMACVPPGERSEAMKQSWARRVYVLSRALTGSPGTLIDKHRKDLMPVLRDLLADSTADYVDERGRHTPVPAEVKEALEVGLGNRPPPHLRSAPVHRPAEDPVIPEDISIHVRKTGSLSP
jgi:serine/threonine protein phosphatase PrpC